MTRFVYNNVFIVLLNYMQYTLEFTHLIYIYTIDIKKVDKQLTYAMHVKDRYVNGTFIDKLTKWYQ